jgi:hypothetical protein
MASPLLRELPSSLPPPRRSCCFRSKHANPADFPIRKTPHASAKTGQPRPFLKKLTNGHQPRHKGKEQIIMFETAVQEKSTGMLWGVIVAFAALAALLGAGYILIN